jgi:hypothetical protein
VINKIIYSGDVFVGGNFTCVDELKQNILDSMKLHRSSDDIRLFDKKLDTIKYNFLKIDNPALDREFFYKCVSVPVKYLVLNCNVRVQDYFLFLYQQNYNGIELIDIDCSQLKSSKIPEFILKKLKNPCLEKLNTSYWEFHECVEISKNECPEK